MPHGSDFSLVFRRTLGKVVVHVHGALDADAAPTLRERLVDIIDGQGNRDVVVDLRGTTAVHSAGLLVLVDALKRMEDYGGELVLSGPTSWVAAQLRAAGLHKVFLITPEWRHPARGRLGVNRSWNTRAPSSTEQPGSFSPRCRRSPAGSPSWLSSRMSRTLRRGR